MREEAGVEAELVEKLGDVRYWYQRDGRRIAKVVRFFLLRVPLAATSTTTTTRSRRRAGCRSRRPPRALTYTGEREMVRAPRLSRDRRPDR